MPGRTGTAMVSRAVARGRRPRERERILGGQARRRRAKGDEAESRPAGMAFDQPHALGEKRGIAAKPVDEKALDHEGVGRIEHGFRSDDLGDDAAAVDIAEENHRRRRRRGRSPYSQCRFARRLISEALPAPSTRTRSAEPPKPRETVLHGGEQFRLPRLIVARRRLADDAAKRHDLRPAAVMRLQEHRIHIDGRRDAAGARLHRLGAADFAAVRSRRRIVGHVLRLERPHRKAALVKGAAEPGDDQRLADVRPRSLQHQRLRPPRHG